MEHEQRTPHEPSSSTSAYCSTLEELELDVASSSVYASAVEDAGESTSRRTWTSIDYTSDSDDKGYVRVLPGKSVYKYSIDQIKLLEKIGEGGQGTIYTAKIDTTRYGHDTKDDDDDNDSVCVVKLYKGRRFGEWPEAAFGLHLKARFICKFDGYCLEGDSFYLVMTKYDCSLRDVLDKQMKQDGSKGRPLQDVIALHMIIQIAIGMWFLHDNNVIHRDLKADNIFVETSSSGVPVDVYIGDFDVASYVVGTSFWRAPEVLQALKDGERPIFTPKSDVYSYAMTCYEILTGGVPLEELRFSDYDAVLQRGKRPKLPSDLNPKLKDFLGRCWHQDPQARPTSKEIVLELTELHKELITGSAAVSRHFDEMLLDGRSSLDMIEAPEASLLELKTLLEAALVKYNQRDDLVLLMEVVADMEQFQSRFGLRSMKEHPVLPYREGVARLLMFDTLVRKKDVFGRKGQFIIEEFQIGRLYNSIFEAISEGAGPVQISRICDSIFEAISEFEDAGPVRPPQPFPAEDVDCLTDFLAWMEELKARPRELPDQPLKDLKDLDEALGILLDPSEYTSHMRCGRSGQVLSVCRQWLGIDR